jgi:hypothetical protein
MDCFTDPDHTDIHIVEIEVGRAKSNWPILEAWLKNQRKNLLTGEHQQIGGTVPRSYVIGDIIAICHTNGRLRKLEIETNAKINWPIIQDGDESREINQACNAKEVNVLLTTQCFCAVLDRQENGFIAGGGGGLDCSTGGIMEGDNHKITEVVSCRIEEATSVEHQAVNNGAAVNKLGANRTKNQPSISRKGLKSTLDDLECVSAIKNRHARFNLWVHKCQQTTHLNCDKITRNKRHLVHRKGLGGASY